MQSIVYRTTNLVNDRYYIGVHQTNDPSSFDGYLGSGMLIERALKKYGKNNFKREVLAVCETPQLAFELEELVVSYCLGDPRCYNLASGGVGYTDLGKNSRDKGLGFHSWSFEQRSINQKMIQAQRDPEERRSMCVSGGRSAGIISRDSKTGFHAMLFEDRSSLSRATQEKMKEQKKVFFSSDFQSDQGKKGGKANKGFRWYHDDSNEFKYTPKQQEMVKFDEFLKNNPEFSRGRRK